ncbi:MAG: selenium cofactor biosynthesis protein YqeC [Eubacteriales bacterium]|nr:selenium cofactor biosynthesis protein YqeC [Eubacteriales bacterium]
MRVCDALSITKGVTAVVGSGGKTSLIDRLCAELGAEGKVLRLTTTHCWPPAGKLLLNPTPKTLEKAFQVDSVVAVGKLCENGKLQKPDCGLATLFSPADYVFIEADGSRGLPLKAPEEYEPVLTGLENKVIAVAGVTGIGKTIGIAAHRPQRYGALLRKQMDAIITPDDVAYVLESNRGQHKNVLTPFAIVLNQCDTEELASVAKKCAEKLHSRCVLTALQARPEFVEMERE